MNPANLNIYKVTFDDGTIEKVYGFYAAHCWAIAQQLFPTKIIKGLELVNSHNKTDET
jgi:hypothetical protein